MPGWQWAKRKANPVTKKCTECDRSFQTTAPHIAKYCSPKCRSRANWKKKKPEPAKSVKRKCECGRTFTALNKNALYCSNRCAQRASRAARKAMRK